MLAELVISILEEIVARRRQPQVIRVDNGPEYCSQAFVEWCEKTMFASFTSNQVSLCRMLISNDILDAYLFEDLEELRLPADEWMDNYNRNPPHSALGGLFPLAYIKSPESRRA